MDMFEFRLLIFQAITEASQVNFRKSRVASLPDEQGTVCAFLYILTL